MIICGTGHRPNKLLGYAPKSHLLLTKFAMRQLESVAPSYVISGMAQGWDSAIAQAALFLGIPYTAAVPFEGQESKWPSDAQNRFHFLCAMAKEVVHVCEPGYAAWKMQQRNVWMVDNSQAVFALWNGTSGGTANCVSYAIGRQRPIYNVWQAFEQYRGTL